MKNGALAGCRIVCVIAALCDCGGEVGVETGAAGGGAGGSGEMPATGIGGSVVLAIHRLWLGDATLDDAPSPDAWKTYGFDLDGKTSTEQSADLCQPLKGAKTEDIHPDGEDGIDNSFGKNLVPLFLDLSPTVFAESNAAIHTGKGPTILFRLQELGTSHGVSEALPGQRDPDMPPPEWDGSDLWRARSDGLEGGDPVTAKARFSESEVVLNAAGALVWPRRSATLSRSSRIRAPRRRSPAGAAL
jgi:hypothetical protein